MEHRYETLDQRKHNGANRSLTMAIVNDDVAKDRGSGLPFADGRMESGTGVCFSLLFHSLASVQWMTETSHTVRTPSEQEKERLAYDNVRKPSRAITWLCRVAQIWRAGGYF